MIDIYGTTDCNYCKLAQKLCVEKGQDYIYHQIDQYIDQYETLVERIGNFKTVPQIMVDGIHIGGYEELREVLCN